MSALSSTILLFRSSYCPESNCKEDCVRGGGWGGRELIKQEEGVGILIQIFRFEGLINGGQWISF